MLNGYCRKVPGAIITRHSKSEHQPALHRRSDPRDRLTVMSRWANNRRRRHGSLIVVFGQPRSSLALLLSTCPKYKLIMQILGTPKNTVCLLPTYASVECRDTIRTSSPFPLHVQSSYACSRLTFGTCSLLLVFDNGLFAFSSFSRSRYIMTSRDSKSPLLGPRNLKLDLESRSLPPSRLLCPASRLV